MSRLAFTGLDFITAKDLLNSGLDNFGLGGGSDETEQNFKVTVP